MKTKYIKISDKAREELENAQIKGDTLIFVDKITKYSEIKKLFPEIGVTWDKKTKTHYFSNGPEKLLSFLEGKEVIDQKKSFQAFFTPPKIAARAVELAEVNGKSVLEPSCGAGNLLVEIRVFGAKIIKGVEINGEFAEQARSKGFTVANIDFFKLNPKDDTIGYVDRVVMNPPYDKNTWVKHIEHAWKFLKDGGRLVAICPNAQHNRFFKKFIEGKDYSIEEIEAGAFAESGTQIATMIVVINK